MQDGRRDPLDALDLSNLNLSDQAITGRQMSWSVATMMAIMVTRPQIIARVSAVAGGGLQIGAEAGQAEVAARRARNISQAIRKNHPPATETMEFHTRPMAEKGSSSWKKPLPARRSRRSVEASRSSRGMLLRRSRS